MAAAATLAAVGAGAGVALARRRSGRRALRLDGASVAAAGSGTSPDTPGTLPGKAAAVATLANEWARDAAARLFGWRNGDEAEDAIAKDVANELAQILATYGERVLGEPAAGGSGPARRLVPQASSR